MKYFSLRQQWVLLGTALFLFGSLWLSFLYHPPSPSSNEFVKEVVIEVSGEVQNPGVYLFQSQPTLKEAVERAGGLRETARFDSSCSETLETGTLLTVTKQSLQTRSPLLPGAVLPNRRDMKKEEWLWRKEALPWEKHDEIKIKIGRMPANQLLVFSIPLDLNRASAEDLFMISGIGESLAREIIAYRNRRNGFQSVAELKNIKGIGEKKYQSIKEFLAIR